MSLYEFPKDVFPKSYEEMYDIVINELKQYENSTFGMVIGKVTDNNPEIMDDNLHALHIHSVRIGEEKEMIMIDLSSFQPAIDRLMSINDENYAHGFLHDFTLRLIDEVLDEVFAINNYEDSFGATLEHDRALRKGILNKHYLEY